MTERDTSQDTVGQTYDRLGPTRYTRLTRTINFFVPLDFMRDALLTNYARGQVLDVGVGEGTNLPLYPPGCRVVGIDMSSAMLEAAKAQPLQLGVTFEGRLCDATKLSSQFAAESFDTVVFTLVGCTFAQPLKIFRQARSLCKPGGKVLFLEHVRTKSGFNRKFLRAISGLAGSSLHCDPNRDTEEIIQEAGFRTIHRRTAFGGILLSIVAAP